MKSILSVKLNLQPAWLWWIDFQRRSLCNLCRLFWLPNSQRWSQHVQFAGCHGNCLHTSDASGDWLHVFYIHCILFGKYTKSLGNSLKQSRKIDVSIVNLHLPCQWLWRVALLILSYWVSFHQEFFILTESSTFAACHDVAFASRCQKCHSDVDWQWGSRQHFHSLLVGVPCCFSSSLSSGCLIYEISIYYDVSRCIVMFLLGISSHAAKKNQTCVFDSLNGLFLGKIYRKP